MKVLYCQKNYLLDYRAGDSVNAHEIHQFLISRGHEVIVMRGSGTEPYEIDGVNVVAKDHKWYKWADVICTCLDYTQMIIEEVGHLRPVIFYMHNTFYEITLHRNLHVSIIYNSQHTKDNCGFVNDGYVLTPPVDPDYYDVSGGNGESWNHEYITLINCNPGKGVEMFAKIAAAMPNERFLAVNGGYGIQTPPSLPNVEIWPIQSDIREVYKVTRLLLMPSLYESWGRTATEAMANGIPVICNHTFGLEENCGEDGIFCSTLESYIEAISRMKDKKEYDKQSEAVKKRVVSPIRKLEGLEAFMKKKVVEHTKKKESVQFSN
jgi:glycosyltransferase involved in cell wall biosynthesis